VGVRAANRGAHVSPVRVDQECRVIPYYRYSVPRTADETATRLEAIERRLSALEGEQPPGTPATPSAPSGTWWLLETLQARPAEPPFVAGVPDWRDTADGEPGGATATTNVRGSVAFGGAVTSPGAPDLRWQLERPVPWLLERDWADAAPMIAALGHPVRLAIVRALLLGATTLQDLHALPGIGTTGQLQHHLRELRSSGVVTQPGRSRYAVAADRVVPALAVVAACLGV
jgi:hypothetical protein